MFTIGLTKIAHLENMSQSIESLIIQHTPTTKDFRVTEVTTFS